VPGCGGGLAQEASGAGEGAAPGVGGRRFEGVPVTGGGLRGAAEAPEQAARVAGKR